MFWSFSVSTFIVRLLQIPLFIKRFSVSCIPSDLFQEISVRVSKRTCPWIDQQLIWNLPAYIRRLVFFFGRLSERSTYVFESNSIYIELFVHYYGASFIKILYLTDLAQKLLSLRIFIYLCAEIDICARIKLSLCALSYLCAEIAISVRI